MYRVGDKATVLPSGIESTISRIETNLKDVKEAHVGQSVVLHLADDIDISRGDSIVVTNQTAEATVSNEIEAHICWFDERQPLHEGTKLLLQNGANKVKAIVREIEYKYDISTLEKVSAVGDRGAVGKLNDIVKVLLKTAKPIVFDNYSQNRQTGSFILVNENTSNTVAAGMISGKYNVDDFEI